MNDYWAGATIAAAFIGLVLSLRNAWVMQRLSNDVTLYGLAGADAKRAAWEAHEAASRIAEASGLKWIPPQGGRWVKQ